jgi:hypothetical protein
MRIKCAVVSAFVSIAFASQASAVLRPLFPIKPAAPFNGELIVIGDDMVRSEKTRAASARSDTVGESGHSAGSWSKSVFGVASFILDIP